MALPCQGSYVYEQISELHASSLSKLDSKRAKALQENLEDAVKTVESVEHVKRLIDLLDQAGELPEGLTQKAQDACATSLQVLVSSFGDETEDLAIKLSTAAVTCGIASEKMQTEARLVSRHAALHKYVEQVGRAESVEAFCNADKDEQQSRQLLSLWKECANSAVLGDDLLPACQLVTEASVNVLNKIVKHSLQKKIEEMEAALSSLKEKSKGGRDGASWKESVNNPDATWDEIMKASRVLFVGQKGADLQTAFKKLLHVPGAKNTYVTCCLTRTVVSDSKSLLCLPLH